MKSIKKGRRRNDAPGRADERAGHGRAARRAAAEEDGLARALREGVGPVAGAHGPEHGQSARRRHVSRDHLLRRLAVEAELLAAPPRSSDATTADEDTAVEPAVESVAEVAAVEATMELAAEVVMATPMSKDEVAAMVQPALAGWKCGLT